MESSPFLAPEQRPQIAVLLWKADAHLRRLSAWGGLWLGGPADISPSSLSDWRRLLPPPAPPLAGLGLLRFAAERRWRLASEPLTGLRLRRLAAGVRLPSDLFTGLLLPGPSTALGLPALPPAAASSLLLGRPAGLRLAVRLRPRFLWRSLAGLRLESLAGLRLERGPSSLAAATPLPARLAGLRPAPPLAAALLPADLTGLRPADGLPRAPLELPTCGLPLCFTSTPF